MSYMNICATILNINYDPTELIKLNMTSSLLGISIRLIYSTVSEVLYLPSSSLANVLRLKC